MNKQFQKQCARRNKCKSCESKSSVVEKFNKHVSVLFKLRSHVHIELFEEAQRSMVHPCSKCERRTLWQNHEHASI